MKTRHYIFLALGLLLAACTAHDGELLTTHTARVDSAYAYLKTQHHLPDSLDLTAEAEWLQAHDAHAHAGKAYYILGAYLNLVGRDSLAMQQLKLAEAEWQLAPDAPAALVGMTYYKQGRISENELLSEVALHHYRRALPYLEEAGDSLYLSSVCREIARTTTDTTEQRTYWQRAIAYAEGLSAPLKWDTRYQMLSLTDPTSPERLSLSRQLCDSAHQYRYAADVVRAAIRRGDTAEAEHYLALLIQDTTERAWSRRQHDLLRAQLLYHRGESRQAYDMLEQVYAERIGAMEEEGAARSYTIAERFDNAREREKNLQLSLSRQRLRATVIIGICLMLLAAAIVTVLSLIRRQHREEQQARMQQLLLQRVARADRMRNIFELDEDWQSFRTHFDAAYDDRLARLEEQYPALTTADMQLIALTEMGLDITDICQVLNVSKQTIWNRRQRIKQHMGK